MGWQTERYEDANEGFADAALPDGAKPRPQYIDMGSSGHMPSSQGVRRGLGPAHRVPGVADLATQARLEQTRIIAAANQAAGRTVGSRSEEPLSYLRVGPRGGGERAARALSRPMPMGNRAGRTAPHVPPTGASHDLTWGRSGAGR